MIESIKNFFKRLFKINYQEKLPELNAETTYEKTNIRDEIKVEDNLEILKLQSDYENERISETELSTRQLINLINLYEHQIREIDYKIMCNTKNT